MGLAPEVSLVVKHTFLELINTPDNQPKRVRSFTDTELLESDGTASGAGASQAVRAAGPSVEASPASRPACWPMTPILEAIYELEALTESGERIDFEATMEVKAFLGMCSTGSQDEGASSRMSGHQLLLPPAASSAYEDQTVSFQPQLWVFLPSAEFQELCCGGQRAGSCFVTSAGIWPQALSTAAPSPASGGSESYSAAGSSSGSDSQAVPEYARTTLMLRNLPKALTRDMLLLALDRMGFCGQYDLVYIPVDFSSGASLGYAFVNMTSTTFTVQLWASFDGLTPWSVESQQPCAVNWSDPHQGLQAHIERYRSSPVMHPDVPDEWKPALFMAGIRVPFPPPQKKLKAPKVRSKSKRLCEAAK
eukprot:CAMPEP_0203890740 /NCGR_PEP_ID=MMETSP0359-20131031/34129_1 /ASSEMBLY_ACC=CAM_ASM_000338 /TAXON_ID=268821 /ORGANISM="Scrippsiella Hangoei, Strain SHTV-5" /LENGTH=363 /DNA_ID=CAMNT_0050812421 /DNA_START=91 /DNA_END=1182 /DNA_ORIENTATION=+